MRKLIPLVLITVLFSCYGPNKAGKQVTKALNEYPDTAAALIRDKFPCVNGKPDSTLFLASIDTLKKLANAAEIKANSFRSRLEQIRDSIRQANEQSGDDCATLLGQLSDYIAESNITRDSLIWELTTEKNNRKKIQAYIASIKPVIQPVKDSAEVRLAIRDRDKALMEAAGWKALYDADHKWKVEQEEKMSGTLPLYIPWWLIIVLSVLLALTVYSRIKTGIFNPLKLIKR